MSLIEGKVPAVDNSGGMLSMMLQVWCTVEKAWQSKRMLCQPLSNLKKKKTAPIDVRNLNSILP